MKAARCLAPPAACAALLMVASPVWAAGSADARADLGQRITALCRATPGAAAGIIPAAELTRALFGSGVVTLQMRADWLASGSRGIAEDARAVFNRSPRKAAILAETPGNVDALSQLSQLALTWARPRQPSLIADMPGPVQALRLLRADGSTWPDTRWSEALAALLAGDDQTVLVTCQPVSAAPEPVDPTPAPAPHRGPEIILTHTPDDLTIAKLSKRPPAELALQIDRDAGTTTLAFDGTLGLRWGWLRLGAAPGTPKSHGLTGWVRPMAYVQLERQSLAGDTFGIDNLSLGLQLGGSLSPGGTRGASAHYFALSGRYLTDTRFLSSSWVAAAHVQPGLGLPGYQVPYRLSDAADLRWDLTGVFDLTANPRPGRKAALANANSWTRLGFDAKAALDLHPAGLPPMDLTASYTARYPLTSGPGRADLFGLRWSYQASTRLSFGLVYEAGTNPDDLNHASTVRATVGLRN